MIALSTIKTKFKIWMLPAGIVRTLHDMFDRSPSQEAILIRNDPECLVGNISHWPDAKLQTSWAQSFKKLQNGKINRFFR